MLRSNRKRKLFFRLAVIAPFVLILLIFSGQIVYISYFNKQVYTASGVDETSPTYLDMEPRDDSTSSWVKRDFEWNGKTIDLNAQTIDGVVYNKSADTIDKWTIRIDITDDCFVNNAWCGTMEIHQHAGTAAEKTQTLDLRKYELSEVTLDHTFDGDLLIPLQKGDYIIYYPSEVDDEIPIAGDSELTMGVIFYYFDSLDFYDYTLGYSYFRTLTQGPAYYVILALGVLWLIGIVVWISSRQIYKDAERQMELKRSALSCMSDLYQSIYIIDLEKDSITPVTEKLYRDMKRPASLKASEQVRNLFEVDAEEEYKAAMFELCDLTTLPSRLEGKQSIAGEFRSKTSGWCSIRFFAMDQIEGRELDRVLFTIQIIEAEKREMADMTEQMQRVKQEVRVGAAFLESLSEEIGEPIQHILESEKTIRNGASEDKAAEELQEIRKEAEIAATKIRDIRDYSNLQTGQTEAERKPFSVEELLSDCSRFAKDMMEGSQIAWETDFGTDLPKYILGDRHFVERVLCNLIEISFEHTTEGSICLSVFGKTSGKKVHLVLSIRDTGDGKKAESSREEGLLVAEGFLLQMGSELHIISTPGVGTESYFELEAETAGETL